MKASMDALIRFAVPAATALTHAPWWMVIGVFVLVLAHRILPWESKDLLTLWLRIIPDQHDSGTGRTKTTAEMASASMTQSGQDAAEIGDQEAREAASVTHPVQT